MADHHRYYRLILGHGSDGRHNLTIEILMNRKDLPAKFKFSKGSANSSYNVDFDFTGDNTSWSSPSRRRTTGGNLFGGRKQVYSFVIDVEDDVKSGAKSFDVFINEIDTKSLIPKRHDGTVHLPGTGG